MQFLHAPASSCKDLWSTPLSDEPWLLASSVRACEAVLENEPEVLDITSGPAPALPKEPAAAHSGAAAATRLESLRNRSSESTEAWWCWCSNTGVDWLLPRSFRWLPLEPLLAPRTLSSHEDAIDADERPMR